MSVEREKLDERYLQAQLREELGDDVDLSETVRSQYFAKHAPARRAIVPAPSWRSVWRPLASAACVLIAAGVAVWALVSYLPRSQQQSELPASDTAEQAPNVDVEPVRESDFDILTRDEQPEQNPAGQPDPEKGEGETGQSPFERESRGDDPTPDVEPEPEPEKPDETIEKPDYPPDWTDPPDAFPDPQKPAPWEDPTEVVRAKVVVAAWQGEDLRVTRGEVLKREKVAPGFALLSGDLLEARKPIDFELIDGTFVRLDGDMVVTSDETTTSVELQDGAAYVISNGISISHEGATAKVFGTSVIEQRLRSLDVFCVSGYVGGPSDRLDAGFNARLEVEGFGRAKAIEWEDVAREFKFVRDIRGETVWREELDEAPGKLFGGEIAGGVLVGESDPSIGIGFYLRAPHIIGADDVVRVRFKLDASTKLVLQFGSTENGNWRHEMGVVKAGEWIEFELPLAELVKTTDMSQSAQPGLHFKFFQLHPEDDTVGIEIDWVEILRKHS